MAGESASVSDAHPPGKDSQLRGRVTRFASVSFFWARNFRLPAAMSILSELRILTLSDSSSRLSLRMLRSPPDRTAMSPLARMSPSFTKASSLPERESEPSVAWTEAVLAVAETVSALSVAPPFPLDSSEPRPS